MNFVVNIKFTLEIAFPDAAFEYRVTMSYVGNFPICGPLFLDGAVWFNPGKVLIPVGPVLLEANWPPVMLRRVISVRHNLPKLPGLASKGALLGEKSGSESSHWFD
ncbi:hypothetical protein [Rhodovulum steppense]|uniref:hypothetical protein n=1 Tax=Rhodovulum steppense TaxID=540251 RepID=UPI00104EC174|nr:hypothetical protein [Rhodovulum steppense]